MKKHILVVDDDDDFLSLLTTLLKKEGYDVKGISNGISIVEEHIEWPDLFILDKQMEFIDGMAISKFLRMHSIGRDIPIVMLSASNSGTSAAAAGINFYLEKPFKVTEFLGIVGHCLSSSQTKGASA